MWARSHSRLEVDLGLKPGLQLLGQHWVPCLSLSDLGSYKKKGFPERLQVALGLLAGKTARAQQATGHQSCCTNCRLETEFQDLFPHQPENHCVSWKSFLVPGVTITLIHLNPLVVVLSLAPKLRLSQQEMFAYPWSTNSVLNRKRQLSSTMQGKSIWVGFLWGGRRFPEREEI